MRAIFAAIGKAIVSTIHYLYLVRIPLLSWIALIALPLLATGRGRPLVLAAYDIQSNLAGFFVGITYGLAGGSIYFTASVITDLCSERFRLKIPDPSQARILKVWIIALFIGLVLNVLTIIRSSEPGLHNSLQIGGSVIAGIFVAFIGVYFGGVISVKLPDNRFYRGLVWLGLKLGLRKQPGYMRETTKPDNDDLEHWDYQAGQIRAVSYAIIVFIAYVIITARDIPPLVALMLLISLCALILTGLTFFWDRYRLPLLAILLGYFWTMGFCPKADHYYRVWTAPPTNPELAPSEIVGRAAQQHIPIVIVAAAGGGIQSAAWTTSVLGQLGKRLRTEPGGGYDFAKSVRLISGVSGGSVGAMFYAQTFDESTPDFTHGFNAASASALGPTVRGLLRQDSWRALAPFLVTDVCDDRGHILERQWCLNSNIEIKSRSKLADVTLNGWGQDALLLKRPALMFNSTIVETGERLAIATVPTRRTLIGETQFRRRYGAEIAVSTAARLSATFPFVTPTGRPTLRDDGTSSSKIMSPPAGGGDQHVVDGGYYENSGLVGAIEWIDEALTDLSRPETNPKHYPIPQRILLLTIDGFERPSDPEDTSLCPVPQTRPLEGPAHGVLYNIESPLIAVMNVRGSGQQSFARRLLRMFERRWALEKVNIQDVKIFFEVTNPENRDPSAKQDQNAQGLKKNGFYVGVDPGKEPLSWHLRLSEINELKKEWRGFSEVNCGDNYESILQFFKSESAMP